MKTHTSRTAQFAPSHLQQEALSGQDGQQAAPPAYGLDFADNPKAPVQPVMSDGQQTAPASLPPPNNTGLPDGLKAGVEQLSGYSMDDVRVHYNSSKPAQLNALAYAQGTEIHLGPGQERHLPHEAWHVVQQKEGRVRATAEVNNVPINDEVHLEKEADVMGDKAFSAIAGYFITAFGDSRHKAAINNEAPLQTMARTNSIPRFQKQDVVFCERNNSNATIQLNGGEIEMTPIRPRIATCRTIGVQHEDGKSFASVRSEASSLQETDKVIYEIAWDAAVAPVGHEGMPVVAGESSDFIVDRSQTGESIGEHQGHYHRDDTTRLYKFLYNDGIEWPTDLNGGSWRFRLRVVNGAGTEVACSEVAIVNWTHD